MKFVVLIILIISSLVCFSQEKIPTENLVLLDIIVTDFDNKPRKSEMVSLTGVKTKKVFSIITDDKGKSSVLLPKGDTYNVTYREISQTVDYTKVEVPSEPGIFTFELIIKYDPGKVYTLENVFFDTGKATLRSESFKALNDLAEVLQLKKTMEIEIAGHTDNVGTAATNLTLSKDRANAVRNYLIKKGIAATRIIAEGYGDTQPVSENTSEEGKQKNRRTEVRILKE